jgi:hypothetical protein
VTPLADGAAAVGVGDGAVVDTDTPRLQAPDDAVAAAATTTSREREMGNERIEAGSGR